MALETIHIENFAGLTEALIELDRMNVFIGPQATGKSVCAKLLFFCKEIISGIAFDAVAERTKPEIRRNHRETFLRYFPPASWGKRAFTVQYSYGDLWIKITRKGGDSLTADVSYSDSYSTLLRYARQLAKRMQATSKISLYTQATTDAIYRMNVSQEIGPSLGNDNYFIPAGRGFFTAIRNSVFSFITNDIGIDPFLAAFGRLYERTRDVYSMPGEPDRSKHLDERISKLLCGKYVRIRNTDYIETDDGRRVALENSSSGQQEAFPLAITLMRIARNPQGATRSTLFVEEPEAHLYPDAQREIVHLFAVVSDLSSDESASQYVITTHSPYILSALNNLMYGAKIARESVGKRDRVARILGDAALINPTRVRAYVFNAGKVRPIINQETGLVEASLLDGVSNELAREFEKLMDIDFEEQIA